MVTVRRHWLALEWSLAWWLALVVRNGGGLGGVGRRKKEQLRPRGRMMYRAAIGKPGSGGYRLASSCDCDCPAATGSSVRCADAGAVCGAVSTRSLGTGGDREMGWKMDG
jgi:hypothetical protein